jgi:hypothetical protein
MHNDYVLIARLMIPTDAHVIRGCLWPPPASTCC